MYRFVHNFRCHMFHIIQIEYVSLQFTMLLFSETSPVLLHKFEAASNFIVASDVTPTIHIVDCNKIVSSNDKEKQVSKSRPQERNSTCPSVANPNTKRQIVTPSSSDCRE